MQTDPLQLTQKEARRLAISAQKLAGTPSKPSKNALFETFQALRCLQLDPIRAVERTQYLVMWSRLGSFRRRWIDDLMREGQIFEYWAHAASMVLTEDYPIHDHFMRRYAKQPRSAWGKRVHQWVHENTAFKQYILDEIKSRGPLLTSEFDDQSKIPWASGGWTSGRSVAYMLDFLWTSGDIMVARREGLKRWWDLTERVLPLDQLEKGWSTAEVTADAAQKSLKGLGVGRLTDINRHFTEKRYPGLKKIVPKLVSEKKFVPAEIDGWPGEWFVHVDQLPLLENLRTRRWSGRTTLLSPFDNLIRDRDRTEFMWNFYYRIEIYVPKAKRQFGYYVLPILHSDTLIGRVNPKMDYKKKVLTVHDVYAEDHAPQKSSTAAAIGRAVDQLGRFLGARRIVYENRPAFWQSELQSHDIV